MEKSLLSIHFLPVIQQRRTSVSRVCSALRNPAPPPAVWEGRLNSPCPTHQISSAMQPKRKHSFKHSKMRRTKKQDNKRKQTPTTQSSVWERQLCPFKPQDGPSSEMG